MKSNPSAGGARQVEDVVGTTAKVLDHAQCPAARARSTAESELVADLEADHRLSVVEQAGHQEAAAWHTRGYRTSIVVDGLQDARVLAGVEGVFLRAAPGG